MSYASKAQLKELAQAIKQKFAKKIDPEAISGNAQQLVASIGVTDQVPYNFRTAGGSADIGNRLNDKIVGGTIAWNQLVTNGNFERTSGWNKRTSEDAFSVENNEATLLLSGYQTVTFGGLSQSCYVKSGHVVLNTCLIKGDNVAVENEIVTTVSYNTESPILKRLTNEYTIIGNVKKSNNYFGTLYVGPYNSGSKTGTIYIKNVQVFDLTAMFGTTIADYIYSLEQATAGAGVAWFKNLFPKPYYEYNAGELMSVCTNEHITRGFNAWDGEVEEGNILSDGTPGTSTDYNRTKNFIRVIGGQTYYSNSTESTIRFWWYDANKNFISSNSSNTKTCTAPSNAKYLKSFWKKSSVPNPSTTVCINLSWSSYRNGEYEPYVEHTYPLSPIELRGIPKLDSANNLYFDGDTYEKDGTVTRKYSIVKSADFVSCASPVRTSKGLWCASMNFGTLTHNNQTGSAVMCNNIRVGESYSSAEIDCVTPALAYNYPAILCLTDTTSGLTSTSSTVEVLEALNTYIRNHEDFSIIYGCVPYNETANPFTDPQIVDDFGTEEYVDAPATAETSPRDVAIPVGHETFYQANLRDKLQNLPTNASADGLYLVKQTGNKMELIAYTPESELPTIQTEGTYVLKSVNGVLTWVLES